MMDAILDPASWTFTQGALLAIFAMMGVTFITRISGFWLLGRVKITPRVRAALEALPGAIILSTVVPIALARGWVELTAVAAAFAVMALLRRDFLAVAAGLATLVGLRALLV